MKKKVLLVDPLAPMGHKDINELYIKLLKDKVDLTYISCEKYPSLKTFESISSIGIPESFFVNGNSLKNRINYYKILLYILYNCKKQNFDSVIFLSYDTISFSIFSFLNRSKLKKMSDNIFIMNHFNIDEIMSSSLKRMLFRSIPKDITHLCYEDFITNFVKLNYQKKAITVRHNLNNYKLLIRESNICGNKYLNFLQDSKVNVVSISNNNISKSLLNNIITLDKEGYLSRNKIKFILKSKEVDYKTENVYIFNEFLSDDEYSIILDKADFVFLPYPTVNYDLRISGVFFDSITFKKPVICTDTSFFKHIFREFGDVGYLMHSDEDLQSILNQIVHQDNQTLFENNIEKVSQHYSDDRLREELMGLVHNSNVEMRV